MVFISRVASHSKKTRNITNSSNNFCIDEGKIVDGFLFGYEKQLDSLKYA
jgi:hypothetical protein